MGATPDELKDEIDRTREELRADVEALAEHLAPKRVARRQVDRAREGLSDPRVRAVLVTGVSLLVVRKRRRRRALSSAA